MAPMFYTIKQAADKLGTTEARIKHMLDDGALREYRDGSRRLLKAADLTDVEIVSRPASLGERQRPAQHKAKSPQHRGARQSRASNGSGKAHQDSGRQESGPSAGEIRLPPTATATVTREPHTRTPGLPSDLVRSAAGGNLAHRSGVGTAESVLTEIKRDTSTSEDQQSLAEDSTHTADRQALDHTTPPSRSFRPASVPRPRPQTHEMSLRQWIWMGLLDDQPFAILLLFATILLGVGAVAGGIYLLIQAL